MLKGIATHMDVWMTVDVSIVPQTLSMENLLHLPWVSLAALISSIQ